MSGTKLIYEAAVVGVATAVGGILLWYLAKALFPKVNYNTIGNHMLILFVLGVALHLTAEYSGVNKWYCKNGVACKN